MFNKKYILQIEKLQKENEELRSNQNLIERHQVLVREIEGYSLQLDKLKKQVADTSNQIVAQDFNLFEPKFDYKDSETYKIKIKNNLLVQREMIANGTAVIMPQKGSITYNDNVTKGNSIIKTIGDLILSTFNSLCEEMYNNPNPYLYEKHKNFILNKFESLNKRTEFLGISINKEFFNLKIERLELEIDKKMQIEKEKIEKQKEQEMIKEQRKVEQEILRQKEKLERERKKYELELQKCKEEDRPHLEEKIVEIDSQIEQKDYRLNNNRAGWCYFIRNDDMLEGTVKIGISRRLNPEERIDELGNASHAFKFSTYGIVFSDDVFTLESNLHQYFSNKRVNKINLHKEFFYATIEELEEALNNFGYNIKLNPAPINEQYILSEKMKGNKTIEA